MIEIIKDTKKKYQINCGCGSIFNFQDEDVKIAKGNLYGIKNNSNLLKPIVQIDKYITCPCCKEELNLDIWHYEEV